MSRNPAEHKSHPWVLAILALALLSFPSVRRSAASEGDWPSFRGPEATGHGRGSTVTEWDVESGTNVLWKTAIPGLGHSSPVIWGDRIFVTTSVPEGAESSLKVGLYGDIAPVNDDTPQSYRVIALDKSSGSIVWEQEAFKGIPAIKRHTKASHTNSTPATDGENLVVFFGSEGLYNYSLDGELKWKKSFGVIDSGFFVVKTAQWGFASSPILHEGKVIVQVDGQEQAFVAALDAATGEEIWRTSREDVPTWSTPAVLPYTGGAEPSMQVVVNGWKHIGGYDLATGEELWKLEGGGDIPVPTPLHANGRIIITNAHGRMRPIYAVETDAKGTITPESDAMAWWKERSGNYMQTPLLHDGLGYFCFDNGVLSVFDLEDGERVFQQRLGGGSSGFSSSPVMADGKLYFTSETGDTYVLKAGREYELLATNELGEVLMSSPAVSDGVLFFRARRHLFAIGAP